MCVLDVGCGVAARGDVNLDLFEGDCYEGIIKRTPPKSRVKNPVMASAECLPFRADSFSEAVSYQVLEHVGSPFQMIREMMRCARSIRLETPNSMHISRVFRSWFRGTYNPDKGHIQVWGAPELRNLLRYCDLKDIVVSHVDPDPIYRFDYPLKHKLLRMIAPYTLKHRHLLATGTRKGHVGHEVRP